MKRTPLKRSNYKLKRTPINKISNKQSKRQRVLAKIPLPTDGRCEKCGQLPDFRGLSKHHIVKRSAGGSDDRANIIIICCKCHDLEHGIVDKEESNE